VREGEGGGGRRRERKGEGEGEGAWRDMKGDGKDFSIHACNS
jgi:hypothetical protein